MANLTVHRPGYSIRALFQWDRGQVLEIHGLSLRSAPEVHFAHEDAETAHVLQSTMDARGVVYAPIPDALLRRAAAIRAWVVEEIGRASKTKREIIIPVIGREMPGDYEMEV